MKETLMKQRLFFISIIGIVVVSLVMGTTFAYQTITMNETETRKVVLEAGVLDVSFETTNLINVSDMQLVPYYNFAEYTEFTVENTNSTTNAVFKIGLSDIDYGYINDSGTKESGCRIETSTVNAACIIDENFKYNLFEVVDDKEILVNDGDFKDLSTNEVILTNYLKIEKNKTRTYRLYLWLKETENNQNHLENTYFKGKILITSLFEHEKPFENTYNNGTLAHALLESALNGENGTMFVEPNLLGVHENTSVPAKDISLSTESIMSYTDDDYTTITGLPSYYFRGNVENNYVEFNNMCFRVVRIEGDGSVRIVLAAQKKCSEINDSDTASAFIGSGDYGYNASYRADYENSQNRTTSMIYIFNEWFNGYLSDGTTKRFSKEVKDKLKPSQICIGVSTKYDYEGNISTATGTYYENYYRLSISENKNATLLCGVEGKLSNTFQIFPLTVDEVVFAGANLTASNSNYYLIKNASHWWWTSSLGYYNPSRQDVIININAYGQANFNGARIFDQISLRPAFSLVKNVMLDTTVTGQNGTKSHPYVID